MSLHPLKPIDGSGRALDRSEELCDAIKEVCYQVGNGMPLSTVIGVLEIAKAEILQEAK